MNSTQKPNAHTSCNHEKHNSSLDELINAGTQKIDDAQKEIHHYTEELVDKIKKNPLKAVLIAGGVGILLSSLLKK